jgi:DNA-binding transcriptional LysR family regulator
MKSSFNFTHLLYFYDAAKIGGVGASAAKNFVTHSAVSQGIKKLEQDIGVSLITHKKREFKLTDAGKALIRESEKILSSVRAFEQQVQRSREIPMGELSFGSSHSIVSAFLLGPLASIRKQYPEIHTSFRLGKTPYVRDWIADGNLDLGITIDDGRLGGLEKIRLASGQFVVIRPSKAKSAKPQFLVTETRPEIVAFQNQYERKHKRAPEILMAVDSWELITKMVEHGLGYGLVPDFQVNRRKGAGIEIWDIGLNIPYELVAVIRKGEQPSRNSQLLLKALKEHLRDLA